MPRILILAFACGFGATALAQAADEAPTPMPALRADAIVASDIVRIGDLIEHAGAMAEIPIFRSPDLGQTGTVPTERVLDAVRPHRLKDIDTRGLTEIAVTRMSRAIGIKEIEERIAAAFAGQYGLGEAKDLAVNFDREVRSLHIEASAGEPRVARANFDRYTARFDVSFEVPRSAAARHMRLRFTGTLIETVEVATLARPVGRGEVIKASDVVIERRPKATVAAGTLGNLGYVAGMSPRRPLQPFQPLRASDLMRPELVRQNEAVTITYEAPGLFLSMRGKALDAGAEGEMVNVLNVQSKRTVQGTVAGPGRVTLAAPATQVVASGAETTSSITAAAPQQRVE